MDLWYCGVSLGEHLREKWKVVPYILVRILSSDPSPSVGCVPDAEADIAGSRWLTLYGFPGLSEDDADGSHLTMVCPVRDSVP